MVVDLDAQLVQMFVVNGGNWEKYSVDEEHKEEKIKKRERKREQCVQHV